MRPSSPPAPGFEMENNLRLINYKIYNENASTVTLLRTDETLRWHNHERSIRHQNHDRSRKKATVPPSSWRALRDATTGVRPAILPTASNVFRSGAYDDETAHRPINMDFCPFSLNSAINNFIADSAGGCVADVARTHSILHGTALRPVVLMPSAH